MRSVSLLATMLLGCGLLPGDIFACRYNVRDVGFVDLGEEAYRLFAYVRQDTSPEFISQFRTLSEEALRDSNVRPGIINVDTEPDHPAQRFLTPNLTNSLPIGVLVSPDGQSLPVALSQLGVPFQQSLATALQDIVCSPTRAEILQQVSRAFGAVLLIEGPDPEPNQRARRAVASAIDQIRAQMKTMPKSIAEPPALVVVDQASLARERILLWSLGLAADQVSELRAAVLYARARWIGPLMKGAEITEHNLTGILAVIGVDCECGLDLTWTLGTRLPVRWDEQRHAVATKTLGFDPESPLVKIEVGRIVERQTTTARSTGDALNASAGAADTRPKVPGRAKSPTPVLATEGLPPLQRALVYLGGVAAVSLVVGAGILWRASRRKKAD
jgi:hypothetical protein